MNISYTRPRPETEITTFIAENADKEMLRFITCGSVDDGKSTLIGRLLLETGAVFDDQLLALKKDSEKHGTTGDEIDPALLLDGLEDERQQGITIDVAYRYFSTGKRKFIIADTPGHEQFTRNMATGASTADLALILVDASKGVLQQTKRHAFIVSLLGIKHVILAVNKMDLIDFDQAGFERIVSEFSSFARQLDFPDIRFVPLSALYGDNVARPSSHMNWYQDGTLLHLLETVYFGSDQNLKDMRFPVQWVNRPNSKFRGFSGTVASGVVRVGDHVSVLPSKKSSQVKSIETLDGQLAEAHAGQSVTLTLKDEIDVVRGDMLVRPGNLPTIARTADAMLVWMSEQPLQPGKSYWFKHAHQRTSCEIDVVRYAIDVNTLHRLNTPTLKLNEIGRCQISTHDPVVFDAYRRNRATGSFIVVDRLTHETVAAGMFLDAGVDPLQADNWNSETQTGFIPSTVASQVTAEQRQNAYAQRPLTILISGLSGAGKSTVAVELERRLFESGRKAVLLDGQLLRSGISRDLGFSAEERSENLRRAAEIAKLLNDAGLICIAAFVAPQENVRAKVKQLIGPQNFLHIHLSTSIEVCRQRDRTGIYAAADRGEIRGLPGVDREFETPADADWIISTETMDSGEIANRILALMTA
jgi:bifunctional enzyme CysN/CysC